ncbi:MAG: S41 family peptidase [Bacteroidales bacterium]|jgi:carboxyl-terminal processing protease|nr:S41 family peptidase [Bacteroidales bacterium]
MKAPSSRYFIYLPIIIALAVISGVYLGFKMVGISQDRKTPISLIQLTRYDKINDVMRFIFQDYVDQVNRESLQNDAIEGMLKNLDPHSQFIRAEDFAEVNDPLLGAFEGIGIQFRLEKDTCTVIHTIVGGPSEKAGLMAGDRIVRVDDSLVAGVGINDRNLVRMLKGEKGSKVKIGVFRRKADGVLDFIITRDVIPTYSVDVAFMADNSIGYIKLSKFSATTHREILNAVNQLKFKGMQKLLLDLRGNSGGFLQSAIKLADEFLEKDQVIVYTEGHNRPRQVAKADGQGLFKELPIVIIIDEGSASASEIIAGAIQDNDRGLIVGRRSFGKGLVQEQLNLTDGSAIRLTVARYYTPTGRSIQKPYDKNAEDYFHDFYERYANGELDDPANIKFDDSLKFVTPGGRTVYGGGGIMPDVYVTIENDENLRFFNIVSNQGLIYQFAFDYTDAQRDKLNQFKNIDDYVQNFKITDKIFNDFVMFVSTQDVKSSNASVQGSKQRIQHMLKAFIARNIFDDAGFYPIYFESDKVYLKAKETLKELDSILLPTESQPLIFTQQQTGLQN